jgi:hypothetical protein
MPYRVVRSDHSNNRNYRNGRGNNPALASLMTQPRDRPMTREKVIAAIEWAFNCAENEMCCSEAERIATRKELAEVLTWIKSD